MKPLLSPTQGHLVRAVVLYLSDDRNNRRGSAAVRVESIETRPWTSLTFDGERHHLVVRLETPALAITIEPADLIVPGFIVAVERADWATAVDGVVVTLDLLTIATATWTARPTHDPRAGSCPRPKLRRWR